MLGKKPIMLGNWIPDNTFWNQNSLSECENVIPQGNGYRPLPALAADGDALDARVRGGRTFRVDDGDTETLAATKTKVYHRQSGGTWSDISGAVTMSTDAPTGFISMVQYGSLAIILNGVDAPYKWDFVSGTGNIAVLGGSPPPARYGTILYDFLVLGHLDTEGNSVQWCSIGNPEEWTPGTNLGDKQEFPDGGRVMGVFGNERLVVFQERKIRLGVFTPGSPETIQFDTISEDVGSVAYRGAAQVGDIVFFLSHSGFHVIEGANVIPIADESVNRWFRASVNVNRISRTICAINLLRKLVIWSFFGAEQLDANADEVYPEHALMYHWPTKKWAHADMSFDAPFDISALPMGLEDLNAFGTLETLTESLDSGLYNNEVLGTEFTVFNSSHKLATLTGENREAHIILPRRQVFAPGRQIIEGIFPVTDAPNVTMAVGERSSLSSIPNVTSYVSKGADQRCPFHSSARMHDIHLKIPAAESWTFVNGVYLDAEQDGEL